MIVFQNRWFSSIFLQKYLPSIFFLGKPIVKFDDSYRQKKTLLRTQTAARTVHFPKFHENCGCFPGPGRCQTKLWVLYSTHKISNSKNHFKKVIWCRNNYDVQFSLPRQDQDSSLSFGSCSPVLCPPASLPNPQRQTNLFDEESDRVYWAKHNFDFSYFLFCILSKLHFWSFSTLTFEGSPLGSQLSLLSMGKPGLKWRLLTRKSLKSRFVRAQEGRSKKAQKILKKKSEIVCSKIFFFISKPPHDLWGQN